MIDIDNARRNYEKSKSLVGYTPRRETPLSVYAAMGFKSGLEIHQQLITKKKLFCRCPAGKYQESGDYDAELIRHMRPTLSELGEYDGTALMEFKTKKNIIYRIKDQTACTYDIDDTPPFPINREALDIAIEIALLLKTNVVGELHITRKQYLDGSIPTGFQRTAIVGIEGEIPLPHKRIGILQISIEEDSCREVADVGHLRTYTTDRLGMPLIETVTYPDMKTPDEAAEAAHYIRFLTRSTGKVRTGIGAARQDTNVSIEGGSRVEIKGVAHIRWIPELTHVEAFRQKALLQIRDLLNLRISDQASWKVSHTELDFHYLGVGHPIIKDMRARRFRMAALNLPGFSGVLSYFSQPGKMFADELSDRLKVIACIEKPNMTHSEAFDPDGNSPLLGTESWAQIKGALNSRSDDAQIVVWGEDTDIRTALETIEERCRLAMVGVPNETRKAFADGTTMFERVLPGPDRMYPDTDSAPIPIDDEHIDPIRQKLPIAVADRVQQMDSWNIPTDTYPYLLKRNVVWIIEKIVADFGYLPRFVGTLFGHTLRHIEGNGTMVKPFNYYTVYGLMKFIYGRRLDPAIAKEMLPELVAHPQMVFESVLTAIGYHLHTQEQILSHLPSLKAKFSSIATSTRPDAEIDWIMGNLRRLAMGNLPLKDLRDAVEREAGRE